ncbi:MAG: hypothetical protein KA248_14080 [Kiritimatiellae bacterium]|nr:hypothetical protein [Kiritimatiellia bacterium]
MKTLVRGMVALVAGIGLLSGCGASEEPAGESTAAPAKATAPTEVTIKAPDETTDVALQLVRPSGWEVNPDYGTLVYEPPNRDDYVDTPNIEIRAAVEGEVSAAAVPVNIARLIGAAKEGWKKIQTGNEALDAQNANVEVVEESADDGDWLLILKVTYPEGVSEAMYPPRYWIYRYLHRADEPFFVCIKGGVTLRYADQFLPAVTEACRSAKRM